MSLGEHSYRRRPQRGMSQETLAEGLNVSRQSVSKWENSSAVPELEKLVGRSRIFEVSLDVLVNGTNPAAEPATSPEAASERGAKPAPEPSLPHLTGVQLLGGILLLGAILFVIISWAVKDSDDWMTCLLLAAPYRSVRHSLHVHEASFGGMRLAGVCGVSAAVLRADAPLGKLRLWDFSCRRACPWDARADRPATQTGDHRAALVAMGIGAFPSFRTAYLAAAQHAPTVKRLRNTGKTGADGLIFFRKNTQFSYFPLVNSADLAYTSILSQKQER